MTANDVIEAYVREVVAQLPRAQRLDVALELQALLREDLDGYGPAPSVEAATALVNAFGAPNEVAARYRPPVTVVDPTDGQRFWRLTLIGLLVIWALGLAAQLQAAATSGADGWRVFSLWWGNAVLPSFWWPGVLVLSFGASAWVRRRWPEPRAWRPLDPQRLVGGRAAMALAVAAIAAGLAVLVDPRWLLNALWGGHLAPAALEAFVYAERFRMGPGPWLWGALALYLPLYVGVMVQGHWTPMLRRAERVLGVLTAVACVAVLLNGPVFVARITDAAFQVALWLTLLGTAATWAWQWHRARFRIEHPSV
jgi:hypothetical protein